MKYKRLTVPVLILLLSLGSGLVYYSRQIPSSVRASPSPLPAPSISSRMPCIPAFLDGGGPYYLDNSPFRSNLAPAGHQGETLIIKGKVLKSDCQTPLTQVTLDIWQANESGNYDDEWYRGRVKTDENGQYSFSTVVPRGYGSGSGFRPPHIHFKIWQDGQLLITSQMFLPESKNQGIEDVYIIKLESTVENGVPIHRGSYDIIIPDNQ